MMDEDDDDDDDDDHDRHYHGAHHRRPSGGKGNDNHPTLTPTLPEPTPNRTLTLSDSIASLL